MTREEMLKQYQVVSTPSGTAWKIISQGYPLVWIFNSPQSALRYVEWCVDRRLSRRPAHGPRDTKRKKCYEAEDYLTNIAWPPLKHDSGFLETLCTALGAKIGLEKVPVPRVRFSGRRGGSAAFVNRIELGRGWTPGVLLHEYAHVCTWDEQPAHGPRWASVYSLLALEYFGEKAQLLADRLHRIFHPPLSPTGHTTNAQGVQNVTSTREGMMEIKLSGTTAKHFDLTGLTIQSQRTFKRGKGSVLAITTDEDGAKEIMGRLLAKDTGDSGLSYEARYAFRTDAGRIGKLLAKGTEVAAPESAPASQGSVTAVEA